MKRHRRVKIVATLGPASSSPDVIERLFECGTDVFRINMSHTTPDRLHELHQTIRDVEDRHNHPIGILADLQGPKLRIGEFKAEPINLMQGQRIIITAGVPLGTPGATNLLRVAFVGEDGSGAL